MQYVAFVHEDNGVFGISFPDFPGCISAGDTLDEVTKNGMQALALYGQKLLQNKQPLPTPLSLDEIRNDRELDDWRAGAILTCLPMILDEGSPRRINVSLDAGLLKAIDAAAQMRGMTRSAFISSATRKEVAVESGFDTSDAQLSSRQE